MKFVSLPGSLLLLSLDFKESHELIVATVVDTDNRKKGQISVEVHRGHFNPRQKYQMLESSAFFEPYKHVLTRIQSKEFERIPFQEYLVGEVGRGDVRTLRSRPNHPKYLRSQRPIFNLGALMQQNMEDLGKAQNILDQRWKNEQYMRLNSSQLKAVKAALSNELSVIQGNQFKYMSHRPLVSCTSYLVSMLTPGARCDIYSTGILNHICFQRFRAYEG